MNAFVSKLLNLNKAISALYIVPSLLVTIGITLSLMLHFDFGLFYTLGVSYLGIYFVTLMLIIIFSIDFRKRVVCSFLHITWVLYLKTQGYWDFISLISKFIKNNLYVLGVDILIVYYQISLLLLVFEGFNTWFWFTTITIVLLPCISVLRHRNNVMLMHNLFSCVEPLLFFLRSAVFWRFGCCIGLSSLFIPEAACGGPGESLPTEGTCGDAPGEKSAINGDTIDCHTPVKRCMPDSAEASSSVLKRQRLGTPVATPSCSVLSGDNTPHLTSPVLRHHVNLTDTGRLIRLDSACADQIDRNVLPCATVVSTLSPEETKNIAIQQAGPRSYASELSSNDERWCDYPFHGSADTSPEKMSPGDPRKRTLDILGLPIAKVIPSDTDVQHLEIVSDGPFRRRLLFTLEQ
jgi:hypothetical protein